MRRPTAICVLVAAGLAESALAQSPPEKSKIREPIIDVHLHAYPAGRGHPGHRQSGERQEAGSQDRRGTSPEGARRDEAPEHREGRRERRLRRSHRGRDPLARSGARPHHRGRGHPGLRGHAASPARRVAEGFSDGQLGVLGEVTAEYAGATLGDPRYEPYLALAEELDIPVALHTGTGPPGISYDECCRGFRVALGNPILIEDALNRHPKLRVTLMHAGWPFLQETIAILFEYPQVYADLGAADWLLPRAEFHAYLGALMRAGFGKRIMFGSDQMYWPEGLGLAIEGIESAPFLTPAEKRDIFYNNAVRFLKLDEAGGRQ